MPACFVKGCPSKWVRKEQDLSLHVFPRDEARIRRWLAQFNVPEERLDELSARIYENKKGAYRVCSKHFSPDSYEIRGSITYLKRDAVPTLYLEEECPFEHAYAKKPRLEDMESSESTGSPQPEEFLHPYIEDFLTVSQNDAGLTTSTSLLTTEDSLECSSLEVAEIEVEVETPISSVPTLIEEPKPRKKKRKMNGGETRTVGVSTEYFPGFIHKGTQFDKAMGTKNKHLQVFRRPSHRSIAIQCDLIKVTNKVSPRGESTSSYTETMHTSTYSQDTEQFEPIPVQESFEYLQSSQKLTAEETCQREMLENENIKIHPKDRDQSYIFIPESSRQEHFVEEDKFIVFSSCLDKLLYSARCQAQTTCPGYIVKLKKYRIGSAISVSAVCSKNHQFHLWQSQPLIGRMPVGNILISAGILCSGSNFINVESLFRIIGIWSICKSTHYTNQKTYLFPTINFHWQEQRLKMIEAIRKEPVVLVGDGQFDSSGHTAKFCMYSFLDFNTKKIIDLQVEHIDTGESAVNLEKKAFNISLDRLRAEKVDIKVLCTDRHAALQKLMKNKYGEICHQFDTWHVAKSIGKKLSLASKSTMCQQIAEWKEPVMNHLWWSASMCGRNARLLTEHWTSIVYHVSNQHEWHKGELYKKCHHKPLSPEVQNNREWLVAGSTAHCKLKDVVLDNRLLKDFKHLSNFCHSSELEVFHTTMQKYHSKHNRCFIDGMVARTQLAAMDHNHNIHSMQQVVKKLASYLETPSHQFCKSKKELLVDKIYEPDNQNFLKEIMFDVLELIAGKHFSLGLHSEKLLII